MIPGIFQIIYGLQELQLVVAFSSLAACSSFISRMRSVAVAAPSSSLSARAFCGVGEVAVAGAFYELQAAHLRKIGTRQLIAFFQRQRLCLP